MFPLAFFLSGLLSSCTRAVSLPEVEPSGEYAEPWRRLLEAAARPDGIDYGLVDRERATLERYLSWIAVHGPELDEVKESNEERRISFMVNAHNAAAVHGVLYWGLHEDARSPLTVRFGLMRRDGAAFLHGTEWRVDGESLSLWRIGTELTFARYQDPLILAALHVPARGSPPLRWWTSKKAIWSEMRAAMALFVNGDQGMRKEGVDWRANELFFLHESEILEWGQAATLCEWLMKYAGGERKQWLEGRGPECGIHPFPFDWGLDVRVPSDAAAQRAPVPAPPEPAVENR